MMLLLQNSGTQHNIDVIGENVKTLCESLDETLCIDPTKDTTIWELQMGVYNFLNILRFNEKSSILRVQNYQV